MTEAQIDNFSWACECGNDRKLYVRKRHEVEVGGRPRCRICGITNDCHKSLFARRLDAHHLAYDRENYELSRDFAILCRSHHQLIEKLKRGNRDNSEYLVWALEYLWKLEVNQITTFGESVCSFWIKSLPHATMLYAFMTHVLPWPDNSISHQHPGDEVLKEIQVICAFASQMCKDAAAKAA